MNTSPMRRVRADLELREDIHDDDLRDNCILYAVWYGLAGVEYGVNHEGLPHPKFECSEFLLRTADISDRYFENLNI